MSIRRQLVAAATVALTVISGAAVAYAPAASAHDNQYPYGKCDQRTKLFQSNIRLSEDPVYPFPANGTGGGVVNSFYNRLGDAITEWNKALGYSEGSGVTKRFQYVGRTSTPNATDVLISYGSPSAPQNGSVSMVTSRPAVCGTSHPAAGQRIQMQPLSGRTWITINIADSDKWFTQEESERTKWENNCDDGKNYNSYSCYKTSDAGWGFTHEMGHVLGFMDISIRDDNLLAHLRNSGVQDYYAPLGANGTTGARCGQETIRPKNTANAATMCPTLNLHSTAGRTLSSYDFATLKLNIG